MKGKDNIYLS